MTSKFFKYPFAKDGDKTAVPDAIQVDGSVSYDAGWTIDYTQNPATTTTGKYFPRTQNNQILYDVTLSLQQYQTIGTPDFITTSANDGTAYPYTVFSRALYDDGTNGLRVYESLINANTALPTDATKWRLDDFSAQKIAVDDSIFNAGVVDGNIVYWDSANSRFDKALADGSAKQQAIGVADVTNKRVLTTGLVTLFSGLTPGLIYYLSGSVAGTVTSTQPDNALAVGTAKTATGVFLNIGAVSVNTALVASVYLSAPQNIPDGNIQVLVELDAVEFDDFNLWDAPNFQYVIQKAGVYNISGRLYWNVPPSGSVYIALYVNGVQYKRLNELNPSTADVVTLGCCLVKCNVNDTLQLYAVNATTSNANVGGDAGIGADPVYSSSFELTYMGK